MDRLNVVSQLCCNGCNLAHNLENVVAEASDIA